MKHQRLDWLDSCRAFAAIIVVAMHSIEIWVPHIQADDWLGQQLVNATHLLPWGSLGVYLFFLVSGFVIPYSVSGEGKAAMRPFLIRRFFRLMPMLWVSIPLGAITTHYLWNKPFGLDAYLSNILLLPNAFGLPFAEGLYWSLQVEVVFYLMIAVLIYFGRFKRTPVLLSLLLVHGTQYLVQKPWFPLANAVPTLMLILEMLKIICLGWLLQRFISRQNRQWLDTLTLGYLLAYHLLRTPWKAYAIFQQGENALGHLTLTIALLIFLTCYALKFSGKISGYLGKISYSLYLLHPVVMYIPSWWSYQPSGSFLKEINLIYHLLFVYAVTIVLSHFSWKYIEAPAQQFARKLTGKKTANTEDTKPAYAG